jgi:hypothetical protein
LPTRQVGVVKPFSLGKRKEEEEKKNNIKQDNWCVVPVPMT